MSLLCNSLIFISPSPRSVGSVLCEVLFLRFIPRSKQQVQTGQKHFQTCKQCWLTRLRCSWRPLWFKTKKHITVQYGCLPASVRSDAPQIWEGGRKKGLEMSSQTCKWIQWQQHSFFFFIAGCMALPFCSISAPLCIIHIICSHYLSTNLLNYFCVPTPEGPGFWYHV